MDEDVKYSKVLRQLKNLKTDQPKIKINPKDILLPEEIKRLINVATLERDRCIVSVLYEGGLRMGELLALTTDMVEMNKKNQEVILHIPDVEGCKTGARSVMCMEIYGYVNDWLKCNPTSRFIPMSPSGISSAVDVLFKRAGITKPSNLHNIRHSSITNAVNIGMQQNMICMRYWGAVFTPMLNVYIHLNEQMTNQGYRNAKGMGEGNGKTVINPLASRCVECGNLIQSGSLCKACTDTKKLTQENQQTKEQLENLIIINKKHMDENSMLKTQMEATQKGYEELKKQMELVTAAMTAMQ
ncbi:MAG: site-specific integrase [Ruminiclostridium sp.]|nr:site-specific integrase [Ruminiclostridium sp.]